MKEKKSTNHKTLYIIVKNIYLIKVYPDNEKKNILNLSFQNRFVYVKCNHGLNEGFDY